MDKPEPRYNYPVRTSPIVLAIRLVIVQLIVVALQLLAALLAGAVEPAIGRPKPLFTLYTLLTLALQILNMGLVIYIVLGWVGRLFLVRSDAIIFQRGIFRMNETRYRTDGIQGVRVFQSFLGRIFNYGTVVFKHSLLGEEVYLPNIPNPHIYERVIDKTKSIGELRLVPIERETDDGKF